MSQAWELGRRSAEGNKTPSRPDSTLVPQQPTLQPPAETSKGSDDGSMAVQATKGGGADGKVSVQPQPDSDEAMARNRFFMFTWLLLDPKTLPPLARKAFRRRWDDRYQKAIGASWAEMDAARRGRLCWSGSGDSSVRELSSHVTVTMNASKPRAAPTIETAADLTKQVGPGERIRIDGAWCRILKISDSKIVLNACAESASETWPQRDGTFPIYAQTIKSENKTRIAKNIRASFEKHILSGDDKTWDYSLLTFLLTYSAHSLVLQDVEPDAWNAVAKLRGLRNTAFAHVSACRMTPDEYGSACKNMAAFVQELLGDEDAKTFKERIDNVKRGPSLSPERELAVRELLEGALRSWGAALGEKIEAVGEDVQRVAGRLKEQEKTIISGFEDAARRRHGEVVGRQAEIKGILQDRQKDDAQRGILEAELDMAEANSELKLAHQKYQLRTMRAALKDRRVDPARIREGLCKIEDDLRRPSTLWQNSDRLPLLPLADETEGGTSRLDVGAVSARESCPAAAHETRRGSTDGSSAVAKDTQVAARESAAGVVDMAPPSTNKQNQPMTEDGEADYVFVLCYPRPHMVSDPPTVPSAADKPSAARESDGTGGDAKNAGVQAAATKAPSRMASTALNDKDQAFHLKLRADLKPFEEGKLHGRWTLYHSEHDFCEDGLVDLELALEGRNPVVIHLACHGTASKTLWLGFGEPEEDSSHEDVVAAIKSYRERLEASGKKSRLRCIVLNACHTKSALGDNLALLLGGNAVVLCWQGLVRDEDCGSFARKLYKYCKHRNINEVSQWRAWASRASEHIKAKTYSFKSVGAETGRLNLMVRGSTPNDYTTAKPVILPAAIKDDGELSSESKQHACGEYQELHTIIGLASIYGLSGTVAGSVFSTGAASGELGADNLFFNIATGQTRGSQADVEEGHRLQAGALDLETLKAVCDPMDAAVVSIDKEQRLLVKQNLDCALEEDDGGRGDINVDTESVVAFVFVVDISPELAAGVAGEESETVLRRADAMFSEVLADNLKADEFPSFVRVATAKSPRAYALAPVDLKKGVGEPLKHGTAIHFRQRVSGYVELRSALRACPNFLGATGIEVVTPGATHYSNKMDGGDDCGISSSTNDGYTVEMADGTTESFDVLLQTFLDGANERCLAWDWDDQSKQVTTRIKLRAFHGVGKSRQRVDVSTSCSTSYLRNRIAAALGGDWKGEPPWPVDVDIRGLYRSGRDDGVGEGSAGSSFSSPECGTAEGFSLAQGGFGGDTSTLSDGSGPGGGLRLGGAEPASIGGTFLGGTMTGGGFGTDRTDGAAAAGVDLGGTERGSSRGASKEAVEGGGESKAPGSVDPFLVVHLVIPNVQVLRYLSDRMLHGKLDQALSQQMEGLVDFAADLSYFAQRFESSILRLDTLSDEQAVLLDAVRGKSAHIQGAAGTGKTFIALHLILEELLLDRDRREQVLFVVRNRALACFVAKWCYTRLRRSLSGRTARAVLGRLHVLIERPGGGGGREEKAAEVPPTVEQVRVVRSAGHDEIALIKTIVETADTAAPPYSLIVVDEAHHLYGMRRRDGGSVVALDFVDKLCGDPSGPPGARLLLLSDLAQSEAMTDDDYPPLSDTFVKQQLRSVSRCTANIMLGAMAFQQGGGSRFKTACAHNIRGDPVQPIIFKRRKPDAKGGAASAVPPYDQYAEETVNMIDRLRTEKFPGMSLHDRVAIIVPDEDFRAGLEDRLRQELDKYQTDVDGKRCYELVDAEQASRCLTSAHAEEGAASAAASAAAAAPEGGGGRDAPGQWLVLDTVDNFDGLERLIVIAVGLDEAGSGKEGTQRQIAVGSRLYRAMTRAHMLTVIVNEYIPDGMLRWVCHLEYDGQAEADAYKPDLLPAPKNEEEEVVVEGTGGEGAPAEAAPDHQAGASTGDAGGGAGGGAEESKGGGKEGRGELAATHSSSVFRTTKQEGVLEASKTDAMSGYSPMDPAAAAAAAAAAAEGPGQPGSSATPRKTVPVISDLDALRSFHEATGRATGWGLSQPPASLASLRGVTCDASGRVIEINCAGNGDNLKGDIGKARWPATLQVLGLWGCSSITGDIGKIQWPAGLKELNLSACKKITGDISAVKWPEGLQKLSLSATEVSGNIGEVQWPASLHTLLLDGCKQISGDIGKVQCPAGLQKMDLQWCEKITGDIGKVQWPASLQTLKLTSCSNVTGDIGKVQWSASLQTLNLTDCKNITGDIGKAQWPAGLQTLYLGGCLNITGKLSDAARSKINYYDGP